MNTNQESESTQLLKSQKPFGSQETWQEHYKNTLKHLLAMAQTKGFKAYTWNRVKEIDNEENGYYRGIQEEFLKNMKEINDLHRD